MKDKIVRVAPAPVLLSAKHASTYLDVPYATLRDYAMRGLLPVVKLGKRWHFRVADLDQFIAKNVDSSWVADPRPRLLTRRRA